MQNFEEWKISYLKTISEKRRLKSSEKVILEMSRKENLSKVQTLSFIRLLQAEYKKYRIDLNMKAKIAAETGKQKELLEKISNIKTKEEKKSRRARAHELITIGALTELIGFPKDRGIVAGALGFVLEKIRQDPNFENLIKTKGNKIIKDREDEKNQKRSQKKIADASNELPAQ